MPIYAFGLRLLVKDDKRFPEKELEADFTCQGALSPHVAWLRGRPYWADDPAFDIDEHVRQVRCPPPGHERALLDLAAV